MTVNRQKLLNLGEKITVNRQLPITQERPSYKRKPWELGLHTHQSLNMFKVV